MHFRASHYSDQQLVTFLQKDHGWAFEELFNRYHSKVLAYSLKFISGDDAHEVVQEVFVKIWQGRNQIDADREFTSYLFRVAKNTLLNHIRTFLRQETLKKGFSIHQNETSTEDDNHIKEGLYQLIERAIDALPPQRRKVFLKSRMEDKSYEEIANELGISKSTVRLQIIKSLKSIRGFMSVHYQKQPV